MTSARRLGQAHAQTQQYQGNMKVFVGSSLARPQPTLHRASIVPRELLQILAVRVK
jgi:hypothetical protein